ncbi:MAG: hypothetical protein EAX96_01705 [Candidatus Lokiarchaeota archaeon]|nr:hypothetical protein [Candidatus Lokiarchaeota archaeon]
MSSWTTDQKETFARILSWGLIIAIVIILAGAIYMLFEMLIQAGTGGLNVVAFFYVIWETSNGLFVLILGGLITGIFALILLFTLLIKSGQMFFLKFIFKIEAASEPKYIRDAKKLKKEKESEGSNSPSSPDE